MKNKKLILRFHILSAIFILALGTLLHFTYELSNNNLFVAAFSAVNESTWEHLKLVFFPMLLTTIIGYFYIGKNVHNFLCARILGIIIAICFIIVFFYTYSGILGKNIDILNIASFFISVLLGEYMSYKIMFSDISCNKILAIISLILLLVCFIIFTYFPPKIGIFKDPITGKYGITDILMY